MTKASLVRRSWHLAVGVLLVVFGLLLWQLGGSHDGVSLTPRDLVVEPDHGLGPKSQIDQASSNGRVPSVLFQVVSARRGLPLPGASLVWSVGNQRETDEFGRALVECRVGEMVTVSCPGFRSAEVEVVNPNRPSPHVVSLHGTGGLSGAVRDEAGVMVPGARIELQGDVVRTDQSGAFTVEGLDCAAAQEVRISAPGFRPLAAEVDIVELVHRDFVLQRRNELRVNVKLGGFSALPIPTLQHRLVFGEHTATPQASVVTFERARGTCVIEDVGGVELVARLDLVGGSVSARGPIRRSELGSVADLEFQEVRTLLVRFVHADGSAVDEPEAFLRVDRDVFTLRLRDGAGGVLLTNRRQPGKGVFWSSGGVSNTIDLSGPYEQDGSLSVRLGDFGGRIVIVQLMSDSRRAAPFGGRGEYGFSFAKKRLGAKSSRTFLVPSGQYSLRFGRGVPTGHEFSVAVGETVECDLSEEVSSLSFSVRDRCRARLSRVVLGKRPTVVEELEARAQVVHTFGSLTPGDYVIALFGESRSYVVYPVTVPASERVDVGLLDAPGSATHKVRLLDSSRRLIVKPRISWTVMPKSIHPKQRLLPDPDGYYSVGRLSEPAYVHLSCPSWFGQVELAEVDTDHLDLAGPHEDPTEWVRLPSSVGGLSQALEVQSVGDSLWFVERAFESNRVRVSGSCLGLLVVSRKLGTQLLERQGSEVLLGEPSPVERREAPRVFLEQVFWVDCPGLRVNLSVVDGELGSVVYIPRGARRVQ